MVGVDEPRRDDRAARDHRPRPPRAARRCRPPQQGRPRRAPTRPDARIRRRPSSRPTRFSVAVAPSLPTLLLAYSRTSIWWPTGRMSMHRKRIAIWTLVVGVAALRNDLRHSRRFEHEGRAVFKVAWIYPGPHNDHGWSQAHDAGRLNVKKALGSRVQTTYKENIFSNAQIPQVVAGPRARRLQDDLRLLVRELLERRQRAAVREVPGRHVRGGDGHADQEEPVPVLRGGRGHDLPLRDGCRRREQEGPDRLHRPVRHPRGRPAHQRVHARRPGDAPGREGEADLDERVVLAAEGDARPRRTSSRPASTCSARTSTATRPASYAEKHGIPWAGYDSNAQKSAPKQWLTAAVYNWGRTTCGASRRRSNGTWKPGFYYGTIKDGFTSIAPFGPKVSAKTKAAIAAKRKAIVVREVQRLPGADLRPERASSKVPKGKTLKVHPGLYSMQWLVKGVVGKVSSVLPPG